MLSKILIFLEYDNEFNSYEFSVERTHGMDHGVVEH